MWPPDPDPDLDPDTQADSGSRPGAALPALRALLPPRAFLCSRKGRLLLAESVSAEGLRGVEGPLGSEGDPEVGCRDCPGDSLGEFRQVRPMSRQVSEGLP